MMIERPPTSVDVGGIDYIIASDFRAMIEIEELIMEKSITEEQKVFAKAVSFSIASCSFSFNSVSCTRSSGWIKCELCLASITGSVPCSI